MRRREWALDVCTLKLSGMMHKMASLVDRQMWDTARWSNMIYLLTGWVG